MFLFFLLQAAAAAPDIQFDAQARIREVRIKQDGSASLRVSASPEGGSQVKVEAPPAEGRQHLRNVDVRVQAEARIADPRAKEATVTPDQR